MLLLKLQRVAKSTKPMKPRINLTFRLIDDGA